MSTVCTYSPYNELYNAAKDLLEIQSGDGKLRLAQAVKAVESEMSFRDSCHELIEAARDRYCDDECEIDDDPLVTEADKGVWIQAWLWMDVEGDDA